MNSFGAAVPIWLESVRDTKTNAAHALYSAEASSSAAGAYHSASKYDT